MFRKPSELQLEACLREAEKIASLMNSQSPRIASELSLSSLISAHIVHTQISMNKGITNLLKMEMFLIEIVWLLLTKELFFT